MVPLVIGGLGPMELGIIVVLVVLLFGADKLPKLARGAGEAMTEFRKAKAEADQELQQMQEETGKEETTTVETETSEEAEKTEASTPTDPSASGNN